MADYVISNVRFNAGSSHVNELLVADEGRPGATRVEQRATVVSKINSGKSYRTQPPGGGTGAPVRVVEVNGVAYLRTDANKTPKDNLDNLSSF